MKTALNNFKDDICLYRAAAVASSCVQLTESSSKSASPPWRLSAMPGSPLRDESDLLPPLEFGLSYNTRGNQRRYGMDYAGAVLCYGLVGTSRCGLSAHALMNPIISLSPMFLTDPLAPWLCLPPSRHYLSFLEQPGHCMAATRDDVVGRRNADDPMENSTKAVSRIIFLHLLFEATNKSEKTKRDRRNGVFVGSSGAADSTSV